MSLKGFGDSKEAPILVHGTHTLDTKRESVVILASWQRGYRVAYHR